MHKPGHFTLGRLIYHIDSLNSIITMHVSLKRDIAEAIAVLKKACARSLKPPDILVTDGLQVYHKFCNKTIIS